MDRKKRTLQGLFGSSREPDRGGRRAMKDLVGSDLAPANLVRANLTPLSAQAEQEAVA
jgi:hypothetical protein